MTPMRTLLIISILSAIALGQIGCDEQAEVRRYETTQPAAYQWPDTEKREVKHEQGGVEWVWDVPEGWVDAPEISSFHVADYRFPGSDTLPGRLTVSVSDGDGGGVRANIQRWRGQLYLVDPKGPAPGDTVSQPMGTSYGGQLTIVEFAGQYQGDYVPTHLLGAVIQFPARDGSVFQTWFFKMVGDRETINANRIKLLRMVLSLRREGDPAPELPDSFFEGAAPGTETEPTPEPAPRPTPLKPIEEVEPDSPTAPTESDTP